MPEQVTHPYGLDEVERLLRLPRSAIRAFVAAGFVSPARGPRKSLRFSFQDLIVLRTAHALSEARLSQQRITRSLKELRKHLPAAMPLSGLKIAAVGDRVVVKDGSARWQADSGQYLLGFEGTPESGAIKVKQLAHALPGNADELFNTAASLETADADAAIHAYEQAIAIDPCMLDARINLGRLLHERGRHAQAERAYREALGACGDDATLFFNLGVLLDDLGRTTDAIAAYERALSLDARLADCHYNLALLYEKLRDPKAAIKHMARYRALAGRAR